MLRKLWDVFADMIQHTWPLIVGWAVLWGVLGLIYGLLKGWSWI